MIEGIRFTDPAVTQVLVGLRGFAFDGLADAPGAAVVSRVEAREQLGDSTVPEPAKENSVPDAEIPGLPNRCRGGAYGIRANT